MKAADRMQRRLLFRDIPGAETWKKSSVSRTVTIVSGAGGKT